MSDSTGVSDGAASEPRIANAARMYDYHLGGAHNFAVDRAAAERTREAMPWVALAVRANRAFLGRAVRYCQQRGIRQFLDLGSGIPTVGNVHEIAHAADPAARVAYVDNEAVAVACSDELLRGDPLITITHRDLRDVDAVLEAPGVADLFDFTEPIALLTVAVMHFVPDHDQPAAILARYRDQLASGSAHVLSHATADHAPGVAARAADTYRETSNPITARTHAQVAAMLDHLELADPGLVDATAWRPERPGLGEHIGYWAAVAHL